MAFARDTLPVGLCFGLISVMATKR